MGYLVKSAGNQWRYIMNDFRNGLLDFSPSLGSLGTPDFPEAFQIFYNYVSEGGFLEPAYGDAKYNDTAIFGSDAIDWIFPYVRPDSSGYLLLAGRGGNLFEVPTSGSSTTITSAVALTSGGTVRYAAQALGYCWISGSNLSMLRYNYGNPGSGGKLSYAGTKAPSNAPTMTLATGNALTIGSGYGYRYAWEYGTSRELGMGWKQSSGLVTPTSGNQSVTITMDASPPTSFSHAVSRALFRNTPNYPSSYFLVTRTEYSGSALATTFNDGTADTTIEGGEETDPTYAETTTLPIYSSLLPPNTTFLALHEGRLWGLDVWSGSTRYPHKAIYSRVSPVGPAPHFDQFEATNVVSAAPAQFGLPTGLMSWMGNLYAFFEYGITVLSSDPGPGRIPAFSAVVAGRGCLSPRSLALTPYGICMISAEGPIAFDGSPTPKPLAKYGSGALKWSVSTSNGASVVGLYEPRQWTYDMGNVGSLTGGYGPSTVSFSYRFSHDYLVQFGDDDWDNFRWSYATNMGATAIYALSASNTAGGNGFIYKRGLGDKASGIDASPLRRAICTQSTDLGMPFMVKRLKEIIIHFGLRITFSASSYIKVSFRPDAAENVVTHTFPTTASRTFRFRFNPATSQFHRLIFNMVLSEADSDAGSSITAIEFVGVSEPERIYSAANA